MLASSEHWLKYHDANVNKINEKSLSEEFVQSWRVVRVQPQRIVSYTCEDGDWFVSISFPVHWNYYSN